MPQTPVATPPREAAEGEMPKLAHQKKGTSTNTQLREYMIREVDHFRRPIDEVFTKRGFHRHLYRKWKQTGDKKAAAGSSFSVSPNKRKGGPKRKHTDEDADAMAEGLKDMTYANLQQAGMAHNCSRFVVARSIGPRRMQRGLKPIVKVTPAKARTDANQPRVYDMQEGFKAAFAALLEEQETFGDDFPSKYGEGDHTQGVYVDRGGKAASHQPYRCKNASAICAIAAGPFRIVKVSVQPNAFKDGRVVQANQSAHLNRSGGLGAALRRPDADWERGVRVGWAGQKGRDRSQSAVQGRPGRLGRPRGIGACVQPAWGSWRGYISDAERAPRSMHLPFRSTY